MLSILINAIRPGFFKLHFADFLITFQQFFLLLKNFYLVTSTCFSCAVKLAPKTSPNLLGSSLQHCRSECLELTKKRSLFGGDFALFSFSSSVVWLVCGGSTTTTSLFAHLFGNHRPSFKIDNQTRLEDSLFPIHRGFCLQPIVKKIMVKVIFEVSHFENGFVKSSLL